MTTLQQLRNQIDHFNISKNIRIQISEIPNGNKSKSVVVYKLLQNQYGYELLITDSNNNLIDFYDNIQTLDERVEQVVQMCRLEVLNRYSDESEHNISRLKDINPFIRPYSFERILNSYSFNSTEYNIVRNKIKKLLESGHNNVYLLLTPIDKLEYDESIIQFECPFNEIKAIQSNPSHKFLEELNVYANP